MTSIAVHGLNKFCFDTVVVFKIKIKENHPVTKLNISDDDVIFTMPAPVDVRMMSYGDRVSGGDR